MILHERTLPNGRRAEIYGLTFGRARLCLISPIDRFMYDDEW